MPIEPARIYFDANIFIYAMETDGERGLLARLWIMQVDRGRVHALTSELTLAEVLPHPIADRDEELVDAYHRLLAPWPTLSVLPVDRSTILHAAQLRADLKADLPDAIHLATAIDAQCTGFLTEDARMRMPAPLRKLGLAEGPPA